MESFKRWNEQIQKTIDERFSKLEQNNQATPVTIESPPETRDDQALAMDRDTTFFNKNIEAEGEKFDAMATGRTKFSKPHALQIDATWHNS
ncbi:10618_t:CDS:2 [Dentiscutata heterogama]|uniref:10618_t:CDS:1 n=1 Tax=Dentiscutata heterogama TaxID=1316150 RepID=A0ACA9LGQ3_9GLOM|nr:10618_t:CDS:2 [Dentiscutata heterogama]